MASGNYIGTDVTGTKALGNGLAGVKADGANGVVGGPLAGAGNVISGNNGPGINLTYDNYLIQGNQIGLDANGNPLGNDGDGILIDQTSSGRQGAAVAQGNSVVGNTIAFNQESGVAVTAFDASLGAATGNSISNNSIFNNHGLGIDLGDDGPTANQPALTTGSGPNHLQNYPVLTSATFGSGQTTIAGTLAGLANRDYTVQFFTNMFADPSGFGEGQTYLGQGTAHTDASGNASFLIPIDSADTRGLWLTATATTPNPQFNAFGSDTSEFSQAIAVTGLPPATPLVVSSDLSIVAHVLSANPQVGHDFTYQFTVTNNGPDLAHTVVFSHTLPAGTQDASAVSTAGAPIISGGTITENLGNLASGDSATITITVTPNVAGSLGGSATVSGFEPDPNSANNTDSFQTTAAPGRSTPTSQ